MREKKFSKLININVQKLFKVLRLGTARSMIEVFKKKRLQRKSYR